MRSLALQLLLSVCCLAQTYLWPSGWPDGSQAQLPAFRGNGVVQATLDYPCSTIAPPGYVFTLGVSVSEYSFPHGVSTLYGYTYVYTIFTQVGVPQNQYTVCWLIPPYYIPQGANYYVFPWVTSNGEEIPYCCMAYYTSDPFPYGVSVSAVAVVLVPDLYGSFFAAVTPPVYIDL